MHVIKTTGIALLTALVSVTTPLKTAAQDQPTVESGDRIRVMWREGVASPYHNYLRSEHLDLVLIDETRLVGRDGDRVRVIPLNQVAHLDKRVRTRPATAPEIVIGSAMGFAAAFTLGALKSIVDPSVEGSSTIVNDGVRTGVLVGAPLGAVAAYLNAMARPLYEEIGIGAQRPVVLPTTNGAVHFGISVPSR